VKNNNKVVQQQRNIDKHVIKR